MAVTFTETAAARPRRSSRREPRINSGEPERLYPRNDLIQMVTRARFAATLRVAICIAPSWDRRRGHSLGR